MRVEVPSDWRALASKSPNSYQCRESIRLNTGKHLSDYLIVRKLSRLAFSNAFVASFQLGSGLFNGELPVDFDAFGFSLLHQS